MRVALKQPKSAPKSLFLGSRFFLKYVKINARGGLLIPIFVRLKGPERILVVLGVLEKPRFYVNTEMSGYWPPKGGECDGMGHRRDL